MQYLKQKKANDKSCVRLFVMRFFIIIRQTSFSRQQRKHIHLGSSLINIFSIKLQSDSLQYEGVMQWRCYEKALAIDFYCIFSNNLHTQHELEQHLHFLQNIFLPSDFCILLFYLIPLHFISIVFRKNILVDLVTAGVLT